MIVNLQHVAGFDSLGKRGSDLAIDALMRTGAGSKSLCLEQRFMVGLQARRLGAWHQCEDLLAKLQQVLRLDREARALQGLNCEVECCQLLGKERHQIAQRTGE